MFKTKNTIKKEQLEKNVNFEDLFNLIKNKVSKLSKNGELNVFSQKDSEDIKDFELFGVFKLKTNEIPDRFLFGTENGFFFDSVDKLKSDFFENKLDEEKDFLKNSFVIVHKFSKDVTISNTSLTKEFYTVNVLLKDKMHSIFSIIPNGKSQIINFKELMFLEPRMTVLFDSLDYESHEDSFFLDSALEDLILNFNKGESDLGYTFLSGRSSHYGAICNNGATGYADRRNYTDLESAIKSLWNDRLIIQKDYKNNIVVDYSHHDGTDSCLIIKNTNKILNAIDSLEHIDILEELNKKVPIKYSEYK